MDEQLCLGQQLLELAGELVTKLGPKMYHKLRRRISAELNFLDQLKRRLSSGDAEPGDALPASVNSSNLPFLCGVLEVAKVSTDVVDVLTHFRSLDVSIDVICEGGHKWVKVIARNPQALHLVWAGKGQYGDRDLLQKAAKYVAAAKRYRSVHPPRLEFHFCSAVTHEMSARLEALGIVVVGRRVDVADDVCRRLKMTGLDTSGDDSDGSTSDAASGDGSGDSSDTSDGSDEDGCRGSSRSEQTSCLGCQGSTATGEQSAAAALDVEPLPCCAADCRSSAHPCWPREVHGKGHGSSVLVAVATGLPRLFLDITALIALASELTHGGCYFVFREQVLTEQAADERANPALPTMERHMHGKELVTCSTALEDFVKLVSVLGGPKEAERAQSLLKTVTIVPDCVSERTARLQISSRIKQRSKVIFGTADLLGCDILTANSGFVRAAAGQGVNYSAFLHPSRALTEKKEKKSTRPPPLPAWPPTEAAKPGS